MIYQKTEALTKIQKWKSTKIAQVLRSLIEHVIAVYFENEYSVRSMTLIQALNSKVYLQ